MQDKHSLPTARAGDSRGLMPVPIFNNQKSTITKIEHKFDRKFGEVIFYWDITDKFKKKSRD